jgi:hypothetical protein
VPGKGDVLQVGVFDDHKSPLWRILAKQKAVKVQDVAKASKLNGALLHVKEASPKTALAESGVNSYERDGSHGFG